MNIKKMISGAISLCFIFSSVVGTYPCNRETAISASAAAKSDNADYTITLEDIKAIQAFCLSADYVGSGNVIDVNNDGLVDVFDLALAKKELIKTGVPSLVDFTANVCDIYLDKSENVVFTLNVTEITPLEDNAISIYDDNDDFVAFMHDDGTDGDETADDGIYSATVPLSSDDIKTVDYYAATDEVKSNSYEICFYRDLEEDEFKNFWILYSNISALPFDEACDFIKSSNEIKTYEIDEQSKVITYQSMYGIYGCWEEIEELSGTSKGSGSYAVPETNRVDYDFVEDTLSSVYITPAHPTKRDVIVLRPFRNSEFQYDDFQTVGNLLADALNSNVTVVDDGNVTLEQMKNLASYGTVLIDSHGTLKINSTPYMLIGEDLDETRFLWDVGYYLQHVGYSADYLSGRIYCTSFRSGQQVFNRMAVGGKFFEKYYSDNSLTDSFWFLGTCYSMYDNSIADALTGKGAEAVVGYTNPVSVEYCNNTLFETVLNSMILSSENVNRSVIEAKRIYGQTDPSDSNTIIKMRGKTNFKLVNTISSNKYTFNGHTYQIIDESMTWSEANAYCEELGGHLATITSQAEQDFIEFLVSNTKQFESYWLGGFVENGEWKWITNEEFLYTNWDPTQPDGGFNDFYLQLFNNVRSETPFGFWDDTWNTGDRGGGIKHQGVICEWEFSES